MTGTEEAERRLGRAVAFGLPAIGCAATLIVGFTASFGSAILVLASTALLSTIALLWASLRTLSGEAPLPVGLETTVGPRPRADALSERKRRVLRALKDLENERDLGKLDSDDYAEVAATYREEAKDIMREMEAEVAPAVEEAERLAREYLKDKGDGARKKDLPKRVPSDGRVTCAACSASNERDAAFCKSCGARLVSEEGPEAHAKA
jgi:hypothetical protein